MSVCSWIREACTNFWKLIVASRRPSQNEATVAECQCDAQTSTKPQDFGCASGPSGTSGGVLGSGEGSCANRFIRTKFPFTSSDPTAANSSAAAAVEDREATASAAATCRQFYGRLKHCDSRTSVGGPMYRYVSSLSLELQAAVVAGGSEAAAHHVHHGGTGIGSAIGGDYGSSWQDRDIVATQLMDKLVSRDLPGAARYCRLLLTLEPSNNEASRLLETLESADRDSPLLCCQDDLVHVGYCSDDMDSDKTGSETQFRYFHHDQHGLNEDERQSRRTTSESDAFLDGSSSSTESY